MAVHLIARPAPWRVAAAAIVVQAIAGLVLGLPGHLSVDSVVQLYEARTLHFISFHPPMMSLLLRVLDAAVTGTALFVVLDQMLLTASFVLLLAQRKSRLGWAGAIVATVVVLNPVLIAYTGIVWKDVLMAHVTGFAYVCLHVASRAARDRGRTAWALAAVLALALAASLRQHALVLAIPGVVYAAVLLAGARAARWGLAAVFASAVVAINIAVVAYADAVTVGDKFPRTETGLRTLATFDLVGIAANGGTIPDAAVAAQANALGSSYTPSQVDSQPLPAGSALWRTGTRDLLALWGRSIAESPGAYLSHRTAHLGALLWRPCGPIFCGVVSDVYVPSLGRDIMPELRLKARWNRNDRKLFEWGNQILDTTPLFNHAFWFVALAVAAAALWARRGSNALVVFAASVTAFALGFAVVGIACDFRYLYVLPVATTLLLFELAVGFGRTTAGRTPDDRHAPAAR